MPLTKKKLESCCGSEAYTYILKTPILKKHVKLFEDEGFRILSHFFKSGMLQATKKGLIVTAMFGSSNLNVRCSGKNCTALWDDFDRVVGAVEK